MDISQYAVDAGSIDALSAFLISKFFQRHPSITKEECDRMAAGIVGGPVSPTSVQGVGSYSVAGDSTEHPKVVQFRHSTLDLRLVGQARKTYGDFVPEHKPRGMLADTHVYEMELVPGAGFSRIRRHLFTPGMEPQLLRAVQDFARYVGVHPNGIECLITGFKVFRVGVAQQAGPRITSRPCRQAICPLFSDPRQAFPGTARALSTKAGGGAPGTLVTLSG